MTGTKGSSGIKMEKADEANGKCHRNNDCNFKPPRGSQFFYPDQQSKTHGRKPKAEFPKRHVNNSKRIAYSTPGPRLVFPSVSGAGAASGKTPEARPGDMSLGKGPAPARSCSSVLRLGLRKGRERPGGTELQTPGVSGAPLTPGTLRFLPGELPTTNVLRGALGACAVSLHLRGCCARGGWRDFCCSPV